MATHGAGQTRRLQARRGECNRARPGGGWEIIVSVRNPLAFLSIGMMRLIWQKEI